MATIPDILIPSDEFVSINSLASVAVGTEMEIQIKGTSPVILYESALKPASNITDGKVLTKVEFAATISAGSDEIWARAISVREDTNSKLNITVV